MERPGTSNVSLDSQPVAIELRIQGSGDPSADGQIIWKCGIALARSSYSAHKGPQQSKILTESEGTGDRALNDSSHDACVLKYHIVQQYKDNCCLPSFSTFQRLPLPTLVSPSTGREFHTHVPILVPILIPHVILLS